MKLFNIFLVSTALSVVFVSCSYNEVGSGAISLITKNNCGLLVFRDSVHYNIVYDYLETKEEEFQASAASYNTDDDEKPLTDFETSMGHSSYRSLILSQEDAAENSGTDLSVNPVPEILDDDEILQTLLNKDRMMVIGSTVYYYYDDCTLFKFPEGDNCKASIGSAIAYFNNYQNNIANHIAPSFYYEKIDICEEEENYREAQYSCPSIKANGCVADDCHPEIVDFFFEFPNYTHPPYTLLSFKYKIGSNGAETIFNPLTDGVTITSNFCEWLVGGFGFQKTINFPAANTEYDIIMTAEFSYAVGNQTQTCTVNVIQNWKVPPPCPIKVSSIITNGLTVTLEGVNNPCSNNTGNDTFTYQPLDGNPIVNPPVPTNTVHLTYSCQGEKKVKITYTGNGCSNDTVISVYPVDPSLCCRHNPGNRRTNCSTHFDNGNYRITVELKERNKKIVAVIRNFKNSKRSKTNFAGKIYGIVSYNKNACDCEGEFSFIPKDKHANYKKKIRIKLKFKTQKAVIEELDQVQSFYWFKHNWSRNVDNPWKLDISTSNIPAQTFYINCTDNCAH